MVKSGAPHPYTSLHLSGGEKWGTSIYLLDDQKYGNSIHLSAGQKWCTSLDLSDDHLRDVGRCTTLTIREVCGGAPLLTTSFSHYEAM